MILETHLHNLVGQSKHDGVLGPHPLLHIYYRSWATSLLCSFISHFNIVINVSRLSTCRSICTGTICLSVIL